jgi:predicted methyltransferase
MLKINYIKSFFVILFINVLSINSFAISLEDVINSETRTKKYKDRDKYRNPGKTLNFFKLKKNLVVIELQPSGGNSPGGWYTEILAPYLKKDGLLIAAHFNPKESEWRAKMRRTVCIIHATKKVSR